MVNPFPKFYRQSCCFSSVRPLLAGSLRLAMATESIYNLIPQPVPPPVKEALYRSKHPGDKPTTFSTFGLTGTSKPGYVNVAGAEEATKGGQHEYKKPFATMGKDGNAVPPTEVLKKKTGGGGGAYAAAMGLSDQSECCLMPFCARECLRRAAPRWRRRGQSCRWTHALGVDLSCGAHAAARPRWSYSGWQRRELLLLLLASSKLAAAVLLIPPTGRSPPARAPLPSPVPAAGAFLYSDRLKPALPSKEELKQVLKASVAVKKAEPKNFVTSNAVENILAVPKREPEPINWFQKPHFGTTPPYLVKIKQEIADEYEYIRSMQQQDDSGVPPGMKQLPEEERQALVDALKSKWQDVNKAYQGSCVLSLKSLDTIGKVKRKEMYEAQLAQIEKDIEKLSRKVILVADD